MKTKSTLIMIVSLSLLIAFSGFAQPQRMNKKGMGCKTGAMGIPDLTTDQIAKIEKLRFKSLVKIGSVRLLGTVVIEQLMITVLPSICSRCARNDGKPLTLTPPARGYP